MIDKISKLAQSPIIRYLFVGGSSYALDLGLLLTLSSIAGLKLTLATTIAFWVALIYNFTLTRFWTFEQKQKEGLKKHIGLYCLLVITNYLLTLLIVVTLSKVTHQAIAKTIAVALQTAWNYPIYKKIIFKN